MVNKSCATSEKKIERKVRGRREDERDCKTGRVFGHDLFTSPSIRTMMAYEARRRESLYVSAHVSRDTIVHLLLLKRFLCRYSWNAETIGFIFTVRYCTEIIIRFHSSLASIPVEKVKKASYTELRRFTLYRLCLRRDLIFLRINYKKTFYVDRNWMLR